MNTGAIITLIISTAVVIIMGLATFVSIKKGENEKREEAAYWKGFSDAVMAGNRSTEEQNKKGNQENE